jgi:hypothetical protein
MLSIIPVIEGLETLDCSNCPRLSSIPEIQSLKILWCDQCISLINIPYIEGLKELYCKNCPVFEGQGIINGIKSYHEWISRIKIYGLLLNPKSDTIKILKGDLVRTMIINWL